MLDYDTIRRLSGLSLKICLVLDYHPEGLTADDIRGILGISKAGFYRGLDAVSKVRPILKNETKFVLEMRKSLNFEKEKEKNQKKEENLKPTTSTTTRMREDFDEKEILFSWLTEREDYLRELAKRNGLLKEGGGGETPETDTHARLIEVFRPYIEEFAERLRLEDVDIWLKGRHDTLKHFYSWLPKYIRAKEAETATQTPPLRQAEGDRLRWRSGYAPQTQTKEQQDEQLLQKRRRMEKAAELQRHMDEQRKAADSDSEAMHRVFARFGLDKR